MNGLIFNKLIVETIIEKGFESAKATKEKPVVFAMYIKLAIENKLKELADKIFRHFEKMDGSFQDWLEAKNFSEKSDDIHLYVFRDYTHTCRNKIYEKATTFEELSKIDFEDDSLFERLLKLATTIEQRVIACRHCSEYSYELPAIKTKVDKIIDECESIATTFHQWQEVYDLRKMFTLNGANNRCFNKYTKKLYSLAESHLQRINVIMRYTCSAIVRHQLNKMEITRASTIDELNTIIENLNLSERSTILVIQKVRKLITDSNAALTELGEA